MVLADLHVHTQVSDGTLALSAVPEAADRAGVEVVAVTDHDRLNPELEEPITERSGVTVVHGIELRVEADGQRVDLLGYGVRPHPALVGVVTHLQRDRIERGRRIVDCVEERLGVALDIEPREGIGRPHIARAIAVSEADYDYQEAFDHLIGIDCPCYIPRDVPSFEDGRAVLQAACGLVGLAHPLRYDNPEGALELTTDLDAVELYYPYEVEVDPEPVLRAVEENNLVVTGGSDAHDDRLGRAGLDEGELKEILAAL